MGSTQSPPQLAWKQTRVQGRPASYGDAGAGTPFVFLHGWGLRDRTYQRAMSRLARLGVRVLTPSLPGFGGTASLPADRFDLDGYARWVADFTAAAGITEPYYLGGHSFGGGVAIKVAHDHDARCKLLVLVNSIGGAVWKQEPGAEPRYLRDRPVWDWGLHLPLDVAVGRYARTVVPVIAQDLIRNLLRDPLGFWRVATLARQANLLPELEELKRRRLPIAVLWGNEDEIMPSASLDAIVAAVGRKAHIVPGGHSWLLADPEGFGEVMTNIIAVAERGHGIPRRLGTLTS